MPVTRVDSPTVMVSEAWEADLDLAIHNSYRDFFFGDGKSIDRELNLKILSIKEVVRTTDKERTHWVVISQK